MGGCFEMKDQEYFKLFEGCGKFKNLWKGWCGITFKNGFNEKDGVEICPECKAKISQAKIEKRKQIKMLEEEIIFLKKVFGWSPNADNRIIELSNKIKQLQEEIEHE